MLPRGRLITFSLVVVLLAARGSARAEPVLPTAIGTTWDYQRAGADSPSLTQRIAGKEPSGGKELLKVETVINDEVTMTEWLSMGDTGVLCHRRTRADGKVTPFDPPQPFVPLPLKVGVKWELDDEVAGTPMHQQFTVVGEEDVTVVAGKFRAFHLHCEQPWPLAITIERWFVPGTGIVKDVTTTRGPTGRLLSRVVTTLNKVLVIAPTPTPTPTPTPAPTPTPGFAIAPVTQIELVVSKERDGQLQTDFRSDAPEIFVRWSGENLPMNSIVRVAWIAEDVGDVAPANFVIDESDTEVTSPTFTVRFTLGRPKDGWAEGKYRLELFLDDELTKKLGVTIEDEGNESPR